jgi:peptidoglycan hydrolase CwlO-like protein
MIFEWSLLTITTVLAIFFYLQVLFYKNLLNKEQEGVRMMKITLKEAEVLIRKYQVQLQRALGNVDLMTTEMMNLKNDLKGIRQSHTALKREKKKLEEEMESLRNKIEALT